MTRQLRQTGTSPLSRGHPDYCTLLLPECAVGLASLIGGRWLPGVSGTRPAGDIVLANHESPFGLL